MSTKYQVIPHKHGVRYLKDGKLTAKNKIRPHIMEELEKKTEVIDPGRYCIFCDKPTNIFRLLDQQPVYLCSEHHQSKNLGQIAQHIRESNASLH